MPSKNMIPKGKRRQTVKHDYRQHRDQVREAEQARKAAEEEALFQGASAPIAVTPQPGPESALGSAEPPAAAQPEAELVAAAELAAGEEEGQVRSMIAGAGLRGRRLDAALAMLLPEVSRARVQLLIEAGQVLVEGKAAKASLKLVGGERIEVDGDPQPPPLHAEPEDIPLKVVFEDADLAVIDKPAGMLVHAGAGDAAHNRGTLVNALLFHLQGKLSRTGGALRPGIVHRLDKDTSGLILVAKNDAAHGRLAAMFQEHDLRKVYLALVHDEVKGEEGTIDLPIGRDTLRRTRMTTRRSVDSGARPAVSHWRVLERLGSRTAPGPRGTFTLLEVHIETGRTHQIRVHLAALGHPVVGDTLYGAPGHLRPERAGEEPVPTLDRNFLHAAELDLEHPRSGKALALRSPLPAVLLDFLESLREQDTTVPSGARSAGRGGKASSRIAKIQAK